MELNVHNKTPFTIMILFPYFQQSQFNSFYQASHLKNIYNLWNKHYVCAYLKRSINQSYPT